jgi:uncharacterized cupin superfamily protein
MAEQSRHLIRAAQIAAQGEWCFRHPLNERSEVHMRSLGDAAGLTRLGIHVGRVPPGAESFVYHWHHLEEEFLYILEGRGIAEIDDQSYEVGPGDFMAFPAPSVGHHLKNPFERDLVYLMGGERRGTEIGEFPRLGKRGLFTIGGACIVDLATTTPFTPR